MIEQRTAHTADLDDDTKAAVRALMDAVFGGVSDDTFDNVLGGVHTLVVEDVELIGHASVVQGRLLHGGRALRTGYIERVAVRPDRRGRGHGQAMMATLERIVRSGYQLGALGASDDGARLYTSRGWQLWRGPSSVLSPVGIRRTPEAVCLVTEHCGCGTGINDRQCSAGCVVAAAVWLRMRASWLGPPAGS